LKPFLYLMPTKIVFGNGCIANLADAIKPIGRAPLIVTGRRSARATGSLQKVLDQCPGAVVFDEVDENPTTDACARGAEVCRAHQCDCVIGLGGGSAMDAAKAIAVAAVNDAPCASFFGVDKFSRALPVIAIPTTAGTGSEATPYAVLVDSETHYKRTISGRGIFPATALLDPELTVTMPRAVTVATGLDALSQALEGATSKRATPIGDLFAFEICRIVRRWLPVAADEPANLEARAQMLHAAMLSGCIISQSGTTLVHGMGYYFTLEFGLAHGLANGLLLPPVMEYNARFLPDKIAALASALGAPESGEPGRRIAAALYALMGDLRISPAAADAGVDCARMSEFAADIMKDPSRFKNQEGSPSQKEVERFFKVACSGSPDER
jgi:alcohol dehydrogenase class IV